MKSCMLHNQLISCMWISPLTSICIPSWFPTMYSEMHKTRNLQCFWSVETQFWYKDFVSKKPPKDSRSFQASGSYNFWNFGHWMFHSRYGPWWDPNSLWQIPLDFWFQSKATESIHHLSNQQKFTQLPTFPGGPSVAPSDAFPGVGTHEDQHRLRAQDIQGRCDRRGVGAAQGHLRVGEKKTLETRHTRQKHHKLS